MENTNHISFDHLDLKTSLEKSGLPLNKWTGRDGTKTLADLLHEVDEGESELLQKEGGGIQRVVHVVVGDVYYVDEEGGKILRLIEDRQVSKIDGKPKPRKHLRGAVAEKMKAKEDPKTAVLRGIREELGLVGDFEIKEETIVEDSRVTSTYPGLDSTYKLHVMPVYIDKNNFRKDGYIEKQETKTTYFVWKEIN